MTTVEEEVAEGSPLESAVPEGVPENAQRAGSVTLPFLASLKLTTQRVRSGAESAGKRAQSAGAKAAKTANTRDSLLHSQPPTFAQAWQQHKDHIGRHEALLITVPRHAWAVIHMTLKAVLNALEWVTATPPRFFIAAAILTVLLIWG